MLPEVLGNVLAPMYKLHVGKASHASASTQERDARAGQSVSVTAGLAVTDTRALRCCIATRATGPCFEVP